MLSMMTADMPRYVSPQPPDLMQQIREMERWEKERNSHDRQTQETKGMNPIEFFTEYAVKD